MISDDFIKAVSKLYNPGMGTEHVAWLLYSMVRMTKPKTVLEVGLGYTTPFILKALADNVDEINSDIDVIQDNIEDPLRRGSLLPSFYKDDYVPVLFAIDDFSGEDITAPNVLEVTRELGIDKYLQQFNSDFKGISKKISNNLLPLDFIWLDCGDTQSNLDFIKEYWPLLNLNNGIFVRHYTYKFGVLGSGVDSYSEMLPGDFLNAIKKQQNKSKDGSEFELISLIEPNKHRQGSITAVRKVPAKQSSFSEYSKDSYEQFKKEFQEECIL